ncbi:dynactin p62 family-domain-containing protein [Apiospora arundinis]|uniref:Dynactin subunit 4 n=1 Tax=Apiospora arundinis TaxID=335852 RepID=A0ABR2J8D8_9PEZI
MTSDPMASFTPYTYIQCPCFDDLSNQTRQSDGSPSPTSQDLPDDDDEDHAFDPRSPRSNYSLYPLEYLLYCVDCHQIRCPRCVSEELVTIYCPSCLFEVGSSSVKTEGNRCTRSCFQCPICVGPLAVQSLESAPEASLLSADNAAASGPTGPWALTCSYCTWSSSEVGIKFDKPQGIFAQLSKIRNGSNIGTDVSLTAGDTSPTKREANVTEPESTRARFSALRGFYQSQLANSSTGSSMAGGIGDYGFSSPAALTRIMSIYSGSSSKPKNKATVMREADIPNEGFRPSNLDESQSISKLRAGGYDGTVTMEQAASQVEEGAHFADDLWPVASLLRTKRAKRCPACRHILSKPEAKVSNTRWRIRLVAGNHIPSVTIKPLPTPGVPSPTMLTPLKPMQYLLTFKNPMFDSIKVTLATPAKTPGRFASKVTVLCPQFTVGANSDDYDLNEVLKAEDRDQRDRRRDDDGSHQVEAGKVFERGRNWVSIVVEVIPASLQAQPTASLLQKAGEPDADLAPLKEDEDILEIPMFVRLEWESEPSQDQVGVAPSGKEKDAKEKRELAYWSVLGIGRISQE